MVVLVAAERPPTLDDGLAIQEVSRLLGLPAPTLRSWERRYGIPTTPRTAGGHRRYSAESLHELRLMRDEIARGRRAGDAAKEVRQRLDARGPAADLQADLLAASARLDPVPCGRSSIAPTTSSGSRRRSTRS